MADTSSSSRIDAPLQPVAPQAAGFDPNSTAVYQAKMKKAFADFQAKRGGRPGGPTRH